MKDKKKLIILGMLAITGSACTGVHEKSRGNKPRPNVIYILADDLGYGDLSCYGQKKFSTPNLDSLAASGMKFTQHYAGSTVCAPSRSVLMTGHHTGHTIVRGNKRVEPLGQYPLPDSIYTLAELFHDAGYITAAFGKWGLGSVFNEGDPQSQGFDHFFGYYSQSMAHRYYPAFLWDDGKVDSLDNSRGELNEYSADIINRKALEFIARNRDSSFFLFLPYPVPHAEIIAPGDSILARFRGKFTPEKSYMGNNYFAPGYDLFGYASQDEGHAVFAAMVTRLDLYVGEIMAALKKYGIEKNTIVIFSSDNGPHVEGGADPDYFDSYGPLRGVKRDLYEGGIRVPFIASWPGKIAPGSESDHISYFGDMFATVQDLLDTDDGKETDGVSFLPVMTGKEGQKEHVYLYWEFHEQGGKQAIRKGKWKAVRLNVQKDPESHIELYDLDTDLQELHDISAAHPDLVKEMESLFKQAHTRSEAFPFAWE